MKALELVSVAGGYSEVDIIHGISLQVGSGEIATIVGTNGAGKSTLIKCLIGLLPRVRGDFYLEGRQINRLSAEQRFFAGMAYVPQVANVFPSLTVMENLQVVRGVADIKGKLSETLDVFPDLEPRLKSLAGILSGGERQQLAFARAMMASPRVLILDEPTAALAPKMVEKIFQIVRHLPDRGVSILMVEQRARQALAISDYGYILDQGRCVLEGRPDELLNNPEMTRLYLGA